MFLLIDAFALLLLLLRNCLIPPMPVTDIVPGAKGISAPPTRRLGALFCALRVVIVPPFCVIIAPALPVVVAAV